MSPRKRDQLSPEQQDRYDEFVTAAGCLLALSNLNVTALLTAPDEALNAMVQAQDDTLRHADHVIKQLV